MFANITNLLPEETYNKLKEYSLTCKFEDVVNPIDNVTYPDINIDIPQDVKDEIIGRVEDLLGAKITHQLMFMRMSLEGTPCPHIHHHDLSHGSHSLMLYMNDYEAGGTALVRHRHTGAMYAPESEIVANVLATDSNELDAWVPYTKTEMKENSATIFDAGLLHRAEPIGGFGETQQDARIVLTCFFSLGA